MPETLKDVICALPCDGATTVAFLGALPVALLDATVYRSCPECGGSGLVPDPETVELGNDGEFHIDDLEMLPCPACKDAPTAIVSAALREKAVAAADEAAGEQVPSVDAIVDAVLSTVLGHVRYAKEIWCLSVGGEVWPTCEESRWLGRGDTIAILEEAGKEED